MKILQFAFIICRSRISVRIIGAEISFLFLFLSLSVFAQVNYEPVSKSVYNYLERLSIKGITSINEEMLPFSRKYIAEKIKEIYMNKENLDLTEQAELDFYIREYSQELYKAGFEIQDYEVKNKIFNTGSDNFGFDKYNRFRFFSYSDSLFGVFADPIVGYNIEISKGKTSTLWSNGLNVYGHIGEMIGFDIRFNDNHNGGDYYDNTRIFSPLTGYEFNVRKDFDRAVANLTLSWDWGSITLGKDYNYYGSGEDGKIILSDKAPSFPEIKLEVNPVSWLKFSYLNGVLNSRIEDTSTFRTGPLRNHFSNIEKYFVAHMLSINPFQCLNVSLGESVVYSDKFQPIYLIPVLFFRIADHYLSHPDENAGNAQLFGSFWYKNYWLKTKIYGSLFIDELTISNSSKPSAVAYNIGLKIVDPIIPESDFTCEYTKLQPFVYFHADQAQTYQNYGYDMGHWIGSNADRLYALFNKRLIRGLNIGLSYSYIRKGQEESFSEERYQPGHVFLWGLKNYYTEYCAVVNYELVHDMFISAGYRFLKLKEQMQDESFNISGKNNISFGVRYSIK